MQTTLACALLAENARSNSSNNSSNPNNNNDYNINDNSQLSNNNTLTANTSKTATTTTKRTAQPPPSRSSRTAPQYIKALLMLSVLMSGAGSGGGGLGYAQAAPAPAPAPAPASATTSNASTANNIITVSANRTRLHKRDYSFKERFHLELNRTALDWVNPCGGNWTGPAKTDRRRPCAKRMKIYRDLKSKTSAELRQLRNDNKRRIPVTSNSAPDTADNQAIDTTQSKIWKIQNNSYSFLPNLNTSASHLPLRHVHHELQFFIAAFSYLRHAKLHWDYVNMQKQSVLASELARYRTSARNVLCFVEEAINATSRINAPSKKRPTKLGSGKWQHSANMLPIKTSPRASIETRLRHFRTPLVELHNEAVQAALRLPAKEPREPEPLDAIFLKSQYLKYLKQITQLLHKRRKCSALKAKPLAPQ